MVTLPSGREVTIDDLGDKIRVSWFEGSTPTPHQIELMKGLSDDEIDEECKKYLYGYDEGGEHVNGFFDNYPEAI